MYIHVQITIQDAPLLREANLLNKKKMRSLIIFFSFSEQFF